MAATATICNSTPSFNISSPPHRTPSSNLRSCCLTLSHPSKGLVLFRSENLKRRFWGSDWGVSVRRFEISCKATVITENEFPDKVLRSDLPVLVEFVANWCGPCRLIAPVVDWASQEYKDRLKVVKIDHDSNPKLIEECKVYGLPTLILFKNGQEVPDSRREGAMTKIKLKEYLDTLLETVTAT
ncbi:hypothetical protein AAC387_Pa11g1579 [Persea americana]